MWRKERIAKSFVWGPAMLVYAVLLALGIKYWVVGLMPMVASEFEWWHLIIIFPVPLIVACVPIYFLYSRLEPRRRKANLVERPNEEAVVVELSVRQRAYETGMDYGWAWVSGGHVRFEGARCSARIPLSSYCEEDPRDFDRNEVGIEDDELLELIAQFVGLRFESDDMAVILSGHEISDRGEMLLEVMSWKGEDEPSATQWPPKEFQKCMVPGSRAFPNWLMIIGCGLALVSLTLIWRMSLPAPGIAFQAILSAFMIGGLLFALKDRKRNAKERKEFRDAFPDL